VEAVEVEAVEVEAADNLQEAAEAEREAKGADSEQEAPPSGELAQVAPAVRSSGRKRKAAAAAITGPTRYGRVPQLSHKLAN